MLQARQRWALRSVVEPHGALQAPYDPTRSVWCSCERRAVSAGHRQPDGAWLTAPVVVVLLPSVTTLLPGAVSYASYVRILHLCPAVGLHGIPEHGVVHHCPTGTSRCQFAAVLRPSCEYTQRPTDGATVSLPHRAGEAEGLDNFLPPATTRYTLGRSRHRKKDLV